MFYVKNILWFFYSKRLIMSCLLVYYKCIWILGRKRSCGFIYVFSQSFFSPNSSPCPAGSSNPSEPIF